MQWCTDGAARYASQGARLSRRWLTVLVRLSNRTDSGLDGFHAGSIRLLASKTEVAPREPAARASSQRPAASGQRPALLRPHQLVTAVSGHMQRRL